MGKQLRRNFCDTRVCTDKFLENLSFSFEGKHACAVLLFLACWLIPSMPLKGSPPKKKGSRQVGGGMYIVSPVSCP